MFEMKFSGKYCDGYQGSQHQDRMEGLAKQLSAKGYSRNTVRQYLCEWRRLTKYWDDRGMGVPSSFHAPEVADYLRWRKSNRSLSLRRFLNTSIRIFIEADNEGDFCRRRHSPAKPTTPLFRQWVPPYKEFLEEHRGVRDLRKNILALYEFMEFLDRRGICSLDDLRAKDIHDFCLNPGKRTPVTWVSYMSVVRRFLHYLFMLGELEHNLSFAVGGAKRYRHSELHDVLTEDEVNKILACTDRSNPLGRRDYAILLLAARYGMRPCDIRQIRLDDIHWRERCLVFRQSKTGNPLALPLLPDVSEALIEYLRDGRPHTQARNIFVRHRAPFEPFGATHNLCSVMLRALDRAGLGQRPGSRGLYLLRHTLATRMLGAHVPIKMIGDVLGHTEQKSTFRYTKVDVDALRSVGLSIAEVLQ